MSAGSVAGMGTEDRITGSIAGSVADMGKEDRIAGWEF
jgi:hypothetical protein